MKKILKVLIYIVIAILILIGMFIGLLMYSSYKRKKDLSERRIELLSECNKNLSITQELKVTLLHFEDSDIDTLTFEIRRDHQVVKDTTITGTKEGEYLLSINIPFKEYQISDTITMTTSNGLQYYISNFKHNVRELYGMFGPVALSDCYVVPFYTINGHHNTSRIVKFYAYLETEGHHTQRIPKAHHNYKKLTESYPITQKKVDSISREISRELKQSGDGIDLGLEITPQKSYYLKGFITDYEELKILKINTKTGKHSGLLKNYPIENEF